MADTSTHSWKLLYEAGRQALQHRKLQEAEQSFSAALQLAEDYAPGDPRLAATLNALARVYSLQRRYLAAAALLNRLLEVTERTLGPAHVQVAGVLTNLAEMYTHLGAAREELELRERVLAIRTGDPDANPTSLQRLQERVAELRATIAAQDPPAEEEEEDNDDDAMELRPSVAVTTPSGAHPVALERPASVEDHTGPPVAVVMPLSSVPRVSIPNQPALSMLGVPDHGVAGIDPTGVLTAPRVGRRAAGWSNLYSIAAGVLLVAGVLAARGYVGASDDERVSAGSVSLSNGAASVSSATITSTAQDAAEPEPRTVERMIAERRLDRERARSSEVGGDARDGDEMEMSHGRATVARPPRAPAEVERALRGVDFAVRAVDQRTRAATDSATAIRVQPPTFTKVRIADP